MDKVSISQFSLEKKHCALRNLCRLLVTDRIRTSLQSQSLTQNAHPSTLISSVRTLLCCFYLCFWQRKVVIHTENQQILKGLNVSGYCLETGVPQGSLLEALVFFLHIRDHMHKCAVSVCAPRAYMLRYIWNIRWETQPYNKGLFIALPVSIVVKLYGLHKDQ